jgi:acetyl-CoA carboxylase biotin carboxyl carrier protein
MTEIRAELTANVWKLTVKVGESVTAGQTLAVLESMKMEIPVESPIAGKVAELMVQEGAVIHEGDVILMID